MASQPIKHFLLILGAIIVILPFYSMMSYSFQSQGEIETGKNSKGEKAGFLGTQDGRRGWLHDFLLARIEVFVVDFFH
mgnify:CR=1 FL=1